MKAIQALAVLFSVSIYLSSISIGVAEDTPKVGAPPPLLKVRTLLQAPSGTVVDTKFLSGKVVVLEFWATWCGPCIAAIPHLNALANRFKDEPVQFIAITAEEKGKVLAFLKKRPIDAWIVLDGDRAMNDAYRVTEIPHTVVIGTNGLIAAITDPTFLTEQHITDLLAGRKISLAQSSDDTIAAGRVPGVNDEVEPLFQVLVRASSYTNSIGTGGSGRFTARGYTISDILPRAFDQPILGAARIITEETLPGGRYDFVVNQTNGNDRAVGPLLQEALRSAFGITGTREKREMDVLLLKLKRPNAPGLVISPMEGGAARYGLGVIEGTDFSMSTLASAIERALKIPVLDETGLTNRYDVSVKWQQISWGTPNQTALAKVLDDKLGLELLPVRRFVDAVVIVREGDNAGRTTH